MATRNTTKARAPGADQRDLTYEGIFDAYEVSYTLDYVEIAAVTRHPESQIRLQQANPTRVNQYLAMYKGGRMPPPITVYQDHFEGYRIIDANHRIKMLLKAKQTHAWAYVITDIDETMARWLGASLNGDNGLPLSAGEIELGIETGIALKHPVDTIRRTVGASTSKINRVIRIKKFDERSERIGLDGNKVNDTLKSRFSTALTDDSVFIKAIELQSDANMSTEEWTARDIGLLPKLKDAGSEKDRLDILQASRDDHEAAIKAVRLGKVPRISPVLEVRNVLERAERLITLQTKEAWVPAGEHADEWVDRIAVVRDHLTLVLDAYDEGLNNPVIEDEGAVDA